MTSREEIVAAIRQGVERAGATFGALSAEQLDRQVHTGESGWTAHQVLAHLAGRSYNYEILFRMAAGELTPDLGSFDIDRQNEQIIEQLSGKSRNELLDEVRAVHERMIEQVRAAPDELLEREFPLPSGSLPFGRVLMSAAGRHTVHHTAEVEAALGLSAPSG
jgi:uncharacterized protein (TIGR03083 family)